MTALALIGTDTGVGKTHVTRLLARGLRALGHRVWLHKPVACGGWDGASSEDGRDLRALCGDGQDPATVCPREFPEACSPHLAARAAGTGLNLDRLVEMAQALAAGSQGRVTRNQRPGSGDQGPVAGDQPPVASHLLLETAGGLLAPLTVARESNADLVSALGWPVLLVTRPHLGTLNHTQLTVNEARQRGICVLGLVVNHHQAVADSLAVRAAAGELAVLTGLPVLAELRCAADPAREDGAPLAQRLMAIMP